MFSVIIVVGSRVVCDINLNSEIETARIQKRSLALSVDDGTYFIRFTTSKVCVTFVKPFALKLLSGRIWKKLVGFS